MTETESGVVYCSKIDTLHSDTNIFCMGTFSIVMCSISFRCQSCLALVVSCSELESGGETLPRTSQCTVWPPPKSNMGDTCNEDIMFAMVECKMFQLTCPSLSSLVAASISGAKYLSLSHGLMCVCLCVCFICFENMYIYLT